MWLPNALRYGVPYELFFKLNPKKLEPFRRAKEIDAKEKVKYLDMLAWLIGTYTMDAMGAWWGKNHVDFPNEPRGMEKKHGGKDEMTDGARFAAFAAEHRRKVMEKRKKHGDYMGIG